MSQKTRLILTLFLVTSSLTAIGISFWRQDWRYSLPTPRPAGLYQPPLGSAVPLPPVLARFKRPRRALFLHFVNSRCPCSQFNLEHVRFLTEQFHSAVDFVAVVQTPLSEREARAEYSGLHLAMPMVLDSKARLGSAFGVYSTPQAVLLGETGQLYFRGNYNLSRYCADATTEFARLALLALVNGRPLPAFPQQAMVAYGCPLRRLRTAPVKGDL